MNKSIVVCAIVAMLSGCGGGNSGSDASAVANAASAVSAASGPAVQIPATDNVVANRAKSAAIRKAIAKPSFTPYGWWLANYCNEPGQTGFDSCQSSYTSAIGSVPTGWLTYLAANYTPNDSSFGWAAASYYYATEGAADSYTSPSSGTIPIIGLPMGYSASGNGPGGNLFSAIANGTYDTSIKGSVDAWANAGYTTLVYRPGWEFNGNWYPWSVQNSTQLTNFIKAFKHMYTVLHNEATADGISLYVEWNPNTGGNQAGGTSTWMNWWPGSSYVDIIAIDSYGYPVNTGANATDAGSSTDYSIIQSINFANTEGMLWSLTETGGDNSDSFITDLGGVLQNNPVQYNSFIGLWNTTQGGGVEWSAGSEASAYYTTFVTDNP